MISQEPRMLRVGQICRTPCAIIPSHPKERNNPQKITLTSAEAGKLLRKLNEEHEALLAAEAKSRTFDAAVGEDIESVCPEYNYAATQTHLAEVERKIHKLKHALNVLNSTTVVPEFGVTIDEMLVYIPQLTRRKEKLARMMSVLPKERSATTNMRSNIIDYTYANYDVAKAKTDFDSVSDQLSRAQLALDAVNASVTFEVDLDAE